MFGMLFRNASRIRRAKPITRFSNMYRSPTLTQTRDFNIKQGISTLDSSTKTVLGSIGAAAVVLVPTVVTLYREEIREFIDTVADDPSKLFNSTGLSKQYNEYLVDTMSLGDIRTCYQYVMKLADEELININLTSSSGMTLFHYLIEDYCQKQKNNNEAPITIMEIAKFIEKFKEQINPTAGNCNPLKIAVIHQDKELLQLLVKDEYIRKAIIENKPTQLSHALHDAIFSDWTGGVEVIVDNCAVFDGNRDIAGATPLITACWRNYNDALILKIIGCSNRATVNASNNEHYSALYFAASKGNLVVIKALLDKGAEIDMPNGIYKKTALHIAAENDHLEVARLLVARGADVNALQRRGRKPSQLCPKKSIKTREYLESLESQDPKPSVRNNFRK